MSKKIFLAYLLLVGSFISKFYAQQNTCGTGIPSQQWEDWISAEAAKIKESQKNSQARPVQYTIPVIFHIVHAGEAVGTFPNLSVAEVTSQLKVINDDFQAVGAGISGTPGTFTSLIANTGIRFCLALTNPQGNPLTDPGIDRVNVISNGWTNLTNTVLTSTSAFQGYYNTTIIPNTIWDPTKYLNVWVSARPPAATINAWATYPAGTSIGGLFGGTFGTATNDGIWVWGRNFGTAGGANAPFNGGRTLTHELGHWLGLRHIWGDGNCLTDYCNDTPYQKGPYYGAVSCSSTPIDQCGIGQAPFGEMPCNFMDMTNDASKWMFTQDQNYRIQVAMSQCVNRNILGTHNLCTYTPVPVSSSSAIASFNSPSVHCYGSPISPSPLTPFNTSSGFPNPTFLWSSSPAASFSPGLTFPNPAISFNNPGNYTVTLVATNSVSSSSYSMLISVSGSCTPTSPCIDTLRSIKNTDTLRTHYAPAFSFSLGCPTGFKGYLVGTNCYKDREFAQYFPPLSYSATPNPQVNSVIVLFDSIGTRASNLGRQINCKIYGGTIGTGPGAVVGLKNDSLGKITGSQKSLTISYLGNPTLNPVQANTLIATKIIPFKFNFATPVIINPLSGFFAGVEAPPALSGDSINIFSDNRGNNSLDSSAWYLQSNNSWRNYRFGRGYRLHLAIIPQITCSPITSLKEYQNSLTANVNVVPNPNNGLFNIIFTLPESKDLEIAIHNSLGQLIARDKLNNVSNNVIQLDMSERPEGVYFAKISNGKEEVVKKIVIAR